MESDKFKDWLYMNKIEYSKYVRLSSVRKLFFVSRKKHNPTKFMRILLKDFLDN